MYKALCVVALLLATFALTSGSKPADASATGLPSPVIVARVAQTGQTTGIPTTALFTPKISGVYRISTYLAMTLRGTTGNWWNLQIGWTDDAGTEGPVFLLGVQDDQSVPNAFAWGPNVAGDQTVIVRAVANTPVTYSVSTGTSAANGTY